MAALFWLPPFDKLLAKNNSAVKALFVQLFYFQGTILLCCKSRDMKDVKGSGFSFLQAFELNSILI